MILCGMSLFNDFFEASRPVLFLLEIYLVAACRVETWLLTVVGMDDIFRGILALLAPNIDTAGCISKWCFFSGVETLSNNSIVGGFSAAWCFFCRPCDAVVMTKELFLRRSIEELIRALLLAVKFFRVLPDSDVAIDTAVCC